jgi:hypothetical protein
LGIYIHSSLNEKCAKIKAMKRPKKNRQSSAFKDIHPVSPRRPTLTFFKSHTVYLKLPFWRRYPSLAVAALLLMGGGLFLLKTVLTKAEVADFYPATCLGEWQNPTHAQGEAETFAQGDAPSIFTEENSARFTGDAAKIFCGGFLPSDYTPPGTIESVGLTLIWQIGDTSTSSATSSDASAEDAEVSGPTVTPGPLPEESPPSSWQEEMPHPLLRSIVKSVLAEETTTSLDVASTLTQEIDVTSSPPTSEENVLEAPPEPPPPADNAIEAPTPPTSPIEGDAVPPPEVTSAAAPTETSTANSLLPPSPSRDEHFLRVSYSTDGENWIELKKVNPENWPYLTLSLPIRAWQEVTTFQVSIEGIPTILNEIPAVFLDGLLLEVKYNVALFDGEEEAAPGEVLPPDSRYREMAKTLLEDAVKTEVIVALQFESRQWWAFKARNNEQFDIYLKHRETEEIIQITTTPFNESEPVLGLGRVAWAYATGFEDNERGEIYLYDIASKTTIQITDDAFVDQLPHFLGNALVWEKIDAEGTAHLYRYDLGTTEVMQLDEAPFVRAISAGEESLQDAIPHVETIE